MSRARPFFLALLLIAALLLPASAALPEGYAEQRADSGADGLPQRLPADVRELTQQLASSEPDKGSIMIVAATDMPVTSRQLRRIIKRAGVGLARLGSFWGHGSGDIVIGFSTAQRICSEESSGTIVLRALNEEYINIPFSAMADATEEAVVRSMMEAGPVGNRHSLAEFVKRR